jgi:hypothetical protein
MPAGKRQQTDVMLYTLVAFVGLFIAATTVAVIYYVKFEDQRTIASDSKSELEKWANMSEQRKGLGKIVGTIPRGKSGVGTMVNYLDGTVSLIIGGMPEDTSADIKFGTANRKTREVLDPLAKEYTDFENIDPNTTGLIPTIEKLKAKLEDTADELLTKKEDYNDLDNRFDDAMKTNFEKEQTLLAEKAKYQQQVNDRKQDYDELEAFMRKTTDEQVQTLLDQRDEARTDRDNEHDELLKIQAELKMALGRIETIQKKIDDIMPPPDNNVAAYQPDGKIVLIDDQTGIVHLNIGRDNRVYRGLTFPVYDKNMPIPKNGRGKAEIEVFDVRKTISAARIIPSKMKSPIILGDIIANLIWDSDKTNVFVVAGEFDLDGDKSIDYDAIVKIKALIQKWGGRATDTVSINTDFLVLGTAPKVLKKPTFEVIEVDPMAMEKYQASVQKAAHYNQVQNRAQAFSIPVFNYERFLYFLGYKTQAGKEGAF